MWYLIIAPERKRRAIPTSSFGQALTSLLETSTTPKKSGKQAKEAIDASEDVLATDSIPSTSAVAPTPSLLALKKPSSARKRQNLEKAEAKARKSVIGERKEREDRNRVTDVIGGWGGESERALRKVAQRGGSHASRYPYLFSAHMYPRNLTCYLFPRVE